MEDFAHKFVQLFDEYWYIILIIWAIQIIWTYKDFVEKVNRTTARINSDIENWKQYQTLLESYQHLNDIDSIWTDVEKHKEHLFDWHEKLELFIKQGNSRLEKIESLILQAENDNTLLHQQYNKKIKIAYWIGGSAISLIIVNYIFQIMGLL